MTSERPLSPTEAQFVMLDRVGTVNFTVVLELVERLAPEALRAALEWLPQAHPRLQQHLGPGPAFAAGAPPPALRLVEGAWERAAEEELAAPLDTASGPLLRAVHVRGLEGDTVLLTLHHAVGDGVTGMVLAGDLLQRLGGGAVPRRALGPPLEALLPARARGGRGWLTLMAYAARQAWAWRAGAPRRLDLGDSARPSGQRRRVLHRMLTRTQADLLRYRARAKKTTVHGALTAAAMLASAQVLGGASALQCPVTMIDLREHLQPALEPDAIGVYVSVIATNHRVGAHDPLWPLAQQVRADVCTALERGEPLVSPLSLASLLESVAPLGGDTLYDRLAGSTLGTLTVSNLGWLALPEGPVRLKAAHFVISPFGRNCLALAAATTPGGLACNFTHTEPLLPAAQAERLADLTMQALQGALSDPAEALS